MSDSWEENAEVERIRTRNPVDDMLHDPDYDCAYNFGRECDCSEPTRFLERMRKAGYALVPIDPKKRPEGIVR